MVATKHRLNERLLPCTMFFLLGSCLIGCSASLHQLAREGRLDQLQKRLDGGADVNEKNSLGETPLMVAAEDGRADIVTALLDHGASVNDHGFWDFTALIYAARKDCMETVRILLNHGADPNEKDIFKFTALCYAIGHDDSSMVALLLDGGAYYNLEIPYDKFGSAEGEDFNQHVFTEKRKISIEAVTGTPLLGAARAGQTAIARMLIQKGALVNVKDTRGITSLMWAARRGNVELLQLLLESGADPAATDLQGKTALMHARENNQAEAVKLLEAITPWGQ